MGKNANGNNVEFSKNHSVKEFYKKDPITVNRKNGILPQSILKCRLSSIGKVDYRQGLIYAALSHVMEQNILELNNQSDDLRELVLALKKGYRNKLAEALNQSESQFTSVAEDIRVYEEVFNQLERPIPQHALDMKEGAASAHAQFDEINQHIMQAIKNRSMFVCEYVNDESTSAPIRYSQFNKATYLVEETQAFISQHYCPM